MIINPITITLPLHVLDNLQINAEKRLRALTEGSLEYRKLEDAIDQLIDAKLAALAKQEA